MTSSMPPIPDLNTLRVEIDDEGIAVVALDVPGRSMNVVTPALMLDLGTLIEQLAADERILGIILTSAKDTGFLAGADLTDLVKAYDTGISPVNATAISTRLTGLYRRLETCGKPIAAAINGLALGGGLELCLACHYRVLGDDPKNFIGLPEVKVGLLPGAGGTQRLPRLIGVAAALPLILEGRQVAPAEALQLGIVNALAPKSHVVETAKAWLRGEPKPQQPWDTKGFSVPGGAGPLASDAQESFVAATARATGNGGQNYPAPLAILSAVFEGTQVAFDVGLRIEGKYFGKLLAAPVARNLMRTLFINKGAADKLGARPAQIPRREVTRIGVLGSGLMGCGIANVSSRAGLSVVMLDTTTERAEQGKAAIAAQHAKDVTRGKMAQESAGKLLSRITATADFAGLAGVELIVEAVFENRAVKAEVIRRAEAIVGDDVIFATNTSTLPVTGLAQASARPAQFIGLHFFSPVERMPLVEVIVGAETGKTTISRALDYVGQLRKTPILVHDSPGFFTSRVFSTFVQEGLKMLEEGVAAALIENAAKLAGFPVGPLAISDEVSLSLQQSILKQQAMDGVPERLRIQTGRAVIDRMVDELKRSGRRHGGGFYEYPASGPKRLWPGLTEAFPVATRQPGVDELQRRFLTIMALESARCLEEGVVERPSDADIGSVLGIGYPSWTGGTISYIETIGIGRFVSSCLDLSEQFGGRFRPSDALIARARAPQPFYPR